MAAHLEAAQQLLARELGCAPAACTVLEAQSVTWPDSALGCREPGMMYMQVLTPGYRMVLEHAGQQYTVHTNHGSYAVRCVNPTGAAANDVC